MPKPPDEEPDTSPPGMRQVVERVRRITRENRRLFDELLAGERRFRRLARSVWNVEERERRRLARELHDGLGQTLTALKHQLERARSSAAAEGDERDAQLERAVDLAETALADTRELSRLLRPAMLDDLGLEPALGWLCRTVGESSEVVVERDVRLDDRLSDELETLAFRVVQEALTNVVKHAEARRATVRVVSEDDELLIEIEDDGVGFVVDWTADIDGASDAFGLRAMRDRVELFGGRLAIASTPGDGTSLEARIGYGEELPL